MMRISEFCSRTAISFSMALFLSAIPVVSYAETQHSDDDILMAVAMFWLIVGVIYLVPTIIGFVRNHPNRWLILLLNVVFGATLLGWLGALIWAFSAVHRSPTGNHGGESGLNLFANDPIPVRIEGSVPLSSMGTDGVMEKLSRLKTLHQQGALDDEEYQRLRRPLLAQLAT